MHKDIAHIQEMLGGQGYVADRGVATALYLSMSLHKPLLIEGAAGVGKTEVAKVMAQALSTDLIRLQCYEGLDATTALYEWNYQKQLLHIRLTEQSDRTIEQREHEIFSEEFLLKRPLLEAITRPQAPVLLVDEVDRSDLEFEAFLLEVLSDFQVSIPEVGTIQATSIPYVVLTSNRTRELGDALRRRCLYLWIDYPSFEKELRIVLSKAPGINEQLAAQVAGFMQFIRRARLDKIPGIAETIDWGTALIALHRDHLDRETIEETLGALFKSQDDAKTVRAQWLDRWLRALDRLRAQPQPWSQDILDRVAAEAALPT